MPEGSLFICRLCLLSLDDLTKVINCAACRHAYHFDCYTVHCYSNAPVETWLCIYCLHDIFPFSDVLDTNDLINTVCQQNVPISHVMNYDNDITLDIFPNDFGDHPTLNTNE